MSDLLIFPPLASACVHYVSLLVAVCSSNREVDTYSNGITLPKTVYNINIISYSSLSENSLGTSDEASSKDSDTDSFVRATSSSESRDEDIPDIADSDDKYKYSEEDLKAFCVLSYIVCHHLSGDAARDLSHLLSVLNINGTRNLDDCNCGKENRL